MEDNVEMGEGGINENSEFSFVAPHVSRENTTSGIEPVTPTKVQGKSSFLKRSLDDLSFTPEPPVRKNPRMLHKIKDHLLVDILLKLESLTKVVESQTTHIVALESRVEELSTLSKGNLQANKANRAATKDHGGSSSSNGVYHYISVRPFISGQFIQKYSEIRSAEPYKS